MAANRALALTLAAAAALAAAAGCAAPPPSQKAAASTTASRTGGVGLYDLPEMQSGLAHREVGAENMVAAYRQTDPALREHRFSTAWGEFRAAIDDYEAARGSAPARFQPVIDREVDQVAGYLNQIQRDRASPQ